MMLLIRVSLNIDEIDIVFLVVLINLEIDVWEIGNGRWWKKGSERSLGEFLCWKSVWNLVWWCLSSFYE